jgi:hypothetical protein
VWLKTKPRPQARLAETPGFKGSTRNPHVIPVGLKFSLLAAPAVTARVHARSACSVCTRRKRAKNVGPLCFAKRSQLLLMSRSGNRRVEFIDENAVARYPVAKAATERLGADPSRNSTKIEDRVSLTCARRIRAQWCDAFRGQTRFRDNNVIAD